MKTAHRRPRSGRGARQPSGIVSAPGARLPLHCTSQGKIVLAYMSESEAANLLARVPLTPYTPHTETDAGALLASLPACREAGFAVENGEYKIGLRSISAPVFTGRRRAQICRQRTGDVPLRALGRVRARRARGRRRGADAFRRTGLSGKVRLFSARENLRLTL